MKAVLEFMMISVPIFNLIFVNQVSKLKHVVVVGLGTSEKPTGPRDFQQHKK